MPVPRTLPCPELSTVEQAVAERLAAVGQRYTRGCREVTRAMASAGRPLTIPELLEATDGVPQSTAYRSVAALREAGVVARVAGEMEHAYFELSEVVAGPHHHYLVCLRCGRVENVDAPEAVEQALRDSVRGTARETGFEVSHHRVVFDGLCRNCCAQPGTDWTCARERTGTG